MTQNQTLRDMSKPTDLYLETRSPGIFITSHRYEKKIAEIQLAIHHEFNVAEEDVLYTPPVISKQVVEAAGYQDLFPQMTADLDTMSNLLSDNLMMVSSMCHSLFPLLQDHKFVPPITLAAEGVCFRNEDTFEVGRLRSYRVSEILFAATAIECLKWKETAQAGAIRILNDLGLEVDTQVAEDPFFGRTAELAKEVQRVNEQKIEIVTEIEPGRSIAVASVNSHWDHFAKRFNFGNTESSEPAHSSCIGFGLDRIVLAMKYKGLLA